MEYRSSTRPASRSPRSASGAGRSAAPTGGSTAANSTAPSIRRSTAASPASTPPRPMAWASRRRRWPRGLGPCRNQVSIVTKFGVGYEDMPGRRDSSRGRVLASIDKSLGRLRTDHVDAYLVHWPDPATPLDETMAALDDVVRQGKVRYIGVSNFRLAQIEECMRLRRIDVVQYAWNMFDRRMQAEIFPYCTRERSA